MAPGIGPTAGLAYFYNLDRFKFDAEQRQDCIHQMQNMRLAQWGLFREDVRDVFQLSTSNMDNYILVGALIVTAVMNFIFVGYPEFPLEPRWLLLLWNNCVFACIFFGMVSVWLAMHGSIAQRSARVKILTQAVRPPVPSLKDVEEAMRSQEHFEGDGAGRYFQPPAFALPFALEEKDEIPKTQPTTVDPNMRTLPTGTGVSQRKGRARAVPKTQKEEAIDWLSDAPFAGEEVLQHLQTVDNGGPGRGAVMHSHFWMLRRVQRGYACFDAYARIGLVLAAQHMLLVCAYYSLGHFMSKMDHWPIPAQNPGAAWLSLIAGAFCTTTLFKLDLFCGPKYRNLVQLTLILPPLLSGLAIHLAASRTNHGRGGVRACDQVVPAWVPWALALLACTGHMIWMWVILRVSSPLLESSGLPLSFRSTIYLDLFGWHSRHLSAAAVRRAVDCASWEHPEKMLYEGMERRPDQKCLVAAHKEAKQVLKNLSRLLTAEMAVHLSPEETEDLQQLRFTLDEHLHDLEAQMAMPAGRQIENWEKKGPENFPAWLQASFLEGRNEETCWIDCRSGQVVWSMPEGGQIIDLLRLSASLEELQLRIDDSPRSSDEPVLAAEALPFELMPENPDSEFSSSLLPWKCIRWSCLAQMGVWLVTIGVLLFDPKYYDSPIAPRELYDRMVLQVVQTDWPHDFFRPSALACSADGRHLMIGDQFAIFESEVELLGEHEMESALERKEEEASRNKTQKILGLRTVSLETAVPTAEIDFSFKSIGFLPGKNKLLLLNQGGTQVTEYSLNGHTYVKTWRLSPTLPHKRLEIIQPVEGPEAEQCARDGSGFMNAGWIVYAATDSGQVVTLCPTHRHELHPLHMLISLRRRRPSQDMVEVVDSHTGTTKASAQTVIGVHHDYRTGHIWLLNTNSEGFAEVVVFDAEFAKAPLGRWPLPSGRWWVPGMCNLGDGQGFILAAAADTDRAGQVGGPELWRLVPKQRDF